MSSLKKVVPAVLMLSLCLLGGGGCCFYGEAVSTSPVPPAPPQIVGWIHCSDLLGFMRQIAPRAKLRGVTQEQYGVTTIQEYQRVLVTLFDEPTHIWIALGKLKEWGPTLATGWVWDVKSQEYLLVFITKEQRKLKAYFWNPKSRNFVSAPRIIDIHI